MEKRKRLLIVEDDRIVKNSLERLLQGSECDVVSALTGEEGLEKFECSPFDLVLTDLKLPGMDGIEMISRMRQKDDALPFIVLSAYGEVDDVIKAMQLGAIEFCQKPFDAQQILDLTWKHIKAHPSGATDTRDSARKSRKNAETIMKTTSTADRKREEKISLENIRLLQTLLAPYISVGRQGTGITHNLNGPLTGMMGHVELMKLKHPELDADLDIIISLAKKLRDLIAELQVKHENETIREAQPQNINQILRAEMSYLNSDLFYKHYINHESNFQKSLPNIIGIYADFALAFEEILINAVDVQRDRKDGWMRVTTCSDKEAIYIEVEDQGPGFTDEALKHAFEPFWPDIRVLEDGKVHPGMGLYLARLWLEPYGGRIELGNREEGGARVRITLPQRTG